MINEFKNFIFDNNKLEVLYYNFYSNKLYLEDIYNQIKSMYEYNKIFFNQKMFFPYSGSIICFISIKNKMFFNLEFNGNLVSSNLLINPFKININSKKINIICQEQLNFIAYSYKNYYFKCKTCKVKSSINNNFHFLSLHQKHQIFLCKNPDYIILDYMSLNNLCEQKEFINNIFKTKEFEKNFEFYFNYNNLFTENEQFKIFDDNNNSRYYLMSDISSIYNFGKINYYYGGSGQGKSITLIGTLKYEINHFFYGTFYLNCKTLRTLLDKKDFYSVKQILIDEIAYLFVGEHKKYSETCKEIENFIFEDQFDFWKLIDKILSFCNIENKKFYIGIDQYNDKNDKYNQLKILEEKYVKNKEYFNFLIFSSMNETNIRNFKIYQIFNKPEYNVKEIKNLFQLEISNMEKEKQIIFEKLGKTLKVYNEIKNINDENKLNDYLKEKKKKYLYKLILFYSKDNKYDYTSKSLSNDEIMNIDDKYYQKLLSFKIDEEYSKGELNKIIENVPFRFFDIIENNNSEYIITTCYPLIDEILKDIYKFIVLNRDYDKYKSMLNNKGNALGTLFEYKVIYNLSPNIENNKNNYFENLTINDTLSLDVFVPKENQKNYTANFQKELDLNNTYIVQQNKFGGKDLDFLIIHIKSKNEIYVYGFQVSINKKNIFTIGKLQESYNLLINILNQSFKLNINKNFMYFGYIFDYSRINEYKAIIDKCQKKNLKYALFNTKNNNFYLNENEITNDINAITVNVFNEESNNNIKDVEMKNIEEENYINKINNSLLYIKNNLMTVLNLKIKNFEFIETTNEIEYNNKLLYVQLGNDSIFMIVYKNNKLKIFELKENKIIEQNLSVIKDIKMYKFKINFSK